jgi:hypothetical protein
MIDECVENGLERSGRDRNRGIVASVAVKGLRKTAKTTLLIYMYDN